MLRYFLPMVILLALGVCHISLATAQSEVCPDLEPRLVIGGWARVMSGSPNNLRESPTTSATILGQIPAGDIFRVVDGPDCADEYAWWQVDYVGRTGWTAEGSADTGEYWLEPLEGQCITTSLPNPLPTGGQGEPDALIASNCAPAEPGTAEGEPEGCLAPPEDYTQVRVNGETLNARTLAMLDHAQALYTAEGGVLDFRKAIMQGSYNPGGVSASFGTHDGGGAIDLSVREYGTFQLMSDEIEPMLRALRVAGFAAWLRDFDSLYPGSPIHIHAIAIGDAELSEAARGQIDGIYGYLRGYDGLPREDGIPQPDTSGEMVICGWMEAIGFTDLRD